MLGWKVNLASRPLRSKHRTVAYNDVHYTRKPDYCNFNLCLIWVITTVCTTGTSRDWCILINAYGSCLFPRMCEDEDEDESDEEKERRLLPEVLRRLNSIAPKRKSDLPDELLLRRRFSSSRGTPWHDDVPRVGLLVFIMRRDAMSARDDLFVPSVSLPASHTAYLQIWSDSYTDVHISIKIGEEICPSQGY